MRLLIFILVIGLGPSLSAYIPPVPQMIDQVFKRRKSHLGTELVFIHRIAVNSQVNVVLEEQLISRNRKSFILWKSASSDKPIKAVLKNQIYTIAKERNVRQRSSVVLDAYLLTDPERFTSSLVSEEFVRSDQLVDFKEGFEPEGNPNTWNASEFRVVHPDIYLKRLPAGIGIEVDGKNEAFIKRKVFFRKRNRKKLSEPLYGLMRFEWTDSNQAVGWDFENLQRFPVGGYYPKRMAFESGGTPVIQSEVLSFRPLKQKQWQILSRNWNKTPQTKAIPTEVAAALNLLLGYR